MHAYHHDAHVHAWYEALTCHTHVRLYLDSLELPF